MVAVSRRVEMGGLAGEKWDTAQAEMVEGRFSRTGTNQLEYDGCLGSSGACDLGFRRCGISAALATLGCQVAGDATEVAGRIGGGGGGTLRVGHGGTGECGELGDKIVPMVVSQSHQHFAEKIATWKLTGQTALCLFPVEVGGPLTVFTGIRCGMSN